MAAPDRRKRSRSQRVRDALVWGLILGAAGGAVLGAAIDGLGAAAGAAIGAVLFATTEAIGAARHGPAEPKPLAGRIAASALLMAVFGWLLGLLYGSDHTGLTPGLSGGVMGGFWLPAPQISPRGAGRAGARGAPPAPRGGGAA